MARPSLSLQMKALCFMILLVGHDAARVKQGSDASVAVRDVASTLSHQARWSNEAETQWQVENRACSYRWGRGCAGEGCAYRRLPLDRSWSQSCRLSDDHMLSNPVKYLNLQTDILAAKAHKFAENCPGTSWWNARGTMRCSRRAMHMMRAMEFIAKAQNTSVIDSLSEEEQAHRSEMHDQALNDISGVLGEDGPVVLELQRKMRANPARIRGDPEGAMLELVGLVTILMRGTEQQKEEARASIHAMSEEDGDAGEPSPEDMERASEMASGIDAAMDEARTLLDQHNEVESVLEEDGDGGGALLQLEAAMESGDIEPSAIIVAVVFVVLVWLVWSTVINVIMSILGLLFMFVFLALLGCGLASAVPDQTGVACAQATGIENILNCELQCARRFVRVPFQYARQGINQLATLFE